MRPFHVLFLVFLLIPLIEIYFLLKIGGIIGAFPTILMVVLTAMIGVWLLRIQSFLTFRRLQEHLQRGEAPALEMVEGPLLMLGGALLLTPGFFTDVIGFLCLIPSTRKRMAQYCLAHGFKAGAGFPGQHRPRQEPTVIEGEYKKED